MILALASFAILATSPASAAEQGSAAPALPSWPPAVYSAGATFDENRGVLVVFGGFRGRDPYSAETWEWNGSTWRLAPGPGPSARNGPALVFDVERKKVLLFGGDNASGPLQDTWTWDGSEWKDLAIAGPPARLVPRLAYDRKRKCAVLFGGGTPQGAARGDLCELLQGKWSVLAEDGPEPRMLHATVYDSSGSQVLVFGGGAGGADGKALSDPWGWDGERWSRVAGPAPSARDHAAMACDASTGDLLLYGGATREAGALSDFWIRSAGSWRLETNKASPGPRAGHHLVYDTQRKSVLLFGGFDSNGPSAELWEYKEKGWTRLGPKR